MSYDLQYKPFGNQAILVEWPQEINDIILKDIINYKTKIESENRTVIEDLIIGYNSLTIKYTHEIEDFQKEIEKLKEAYLKLNAEREVTSVTWQIPVCYDEVFGIDLQSISKAKNITIEEVIHLHSKPIYTVYFIGFLPGFLYLGGLDPKLHTNRKATPRLNVAKGFVAIGGKQTGVYPNDSAGGWNIIGKTPVSFFNINKPKPCFAKSGDKIQFIPVSKSDYFQLEKDIEEGVFKLKSIADD